jgi:hypothetical protein
MRLHEAVVVRDFIAAIGGNPPVVEDRVMSVSPLTREHLRLREITKDHSGWRRWGPYLSERSWGTVREDYGPDGNAWDYFPHDLARSKAYRWGEDGLAGICDRYQGVRERARPHASCLSPRARSSTCAFPPTHSWCSRD